MSHLWNVILPFLQLAAEDGLWKHKVIVQLEKGDAATQSLFAFLASKKISLLLVEDLPSETPISALSLQWGPERTHEYPSRVVLKPPAEKNTPVIIEPVHPAESGKRKDVGHQHINYTPSDFDSHRTDAALRDLDNAHERLDAAEATIEELEALLLDIGDAAVAPVRSAGFGSSSIATVDENAPKAVVNETNKAAPVVDRKVYIIEAAEEGIHHCWQDSDVSEECHEPGYFCYNINEPNELIPMASAENFLRAQRSSAGFVRLVDCSRAVPFADAFYPFVQKILTRAGFDGECHSVLFLSPLTLPKVSQVASELHNSMSEYLGAGHSPVYEAYSVVSADPFDPVNVTSLMIYFGYSEAQVFPIYFGSAGEGSLRTSRAIGTKTLMTAHRSTMQSRGESVPDENKLFDELVKVGTVADRGQRALKSGEKLAEQLFGASGILDLVRDCMQSVPEEMQAKILANIVVGGAIKSWPGLVRRLRDEISVLFPKFKVGIKRSEGAIRGAQRMAATHNFTGLYCMDRDGMFQGRPIALHSL